MLGARIYKLSYYAYHVPRRSVTKRLYAFHTKYHKTQRLNNRTFNTIKSQLKPKTTSHMRSFAFVSIASGLLLCCSKNCKSTVSEAESINSRMRINNTIERVVILMAMEEEAHPFILKHNLKLIQNPPWNSQLPFLAYKGMVGRMEVTLVWTGHDKRYKVNNVATTASTVSCYVSIEAFKPDIIISAGTAGGFKSAGGEIADVYLSSKCVFHSRRIPDSGIGYCEYGFGHFRSPPLELLAKQAKCKIGVISTSDSLDYTAKDLQIMRAEGACVKEVCITFFLSFYKILPLTHVNLLS